MKTVHKGILALIIANIIWGFASPIFKWSLTNIPPFTLAFLRFFIATAIMIIILRKKSLPPRMNIDDWAMLILYSLAGITINIAFFFLGLQLTWSINAPIIASSAPILIFIFALILLKEKIKLIKILGMLIGTIGIIIIVLEPILFAGLDGSIIGNLLLVVATLGSVAATLIGRTLFQKFDPVRLMLWAFVIGAITFFPLALAEYLHQPDLFSILDIRGITGILYGSIFSSAAAYTLFAWGLSKIQAGEASLFTYIDPIAGTILAFFMLHEPITLPFIIGAALIFGGIFIAEHRLHYHPLLKMFK